MTLRELMATHPEWLDLPIVVLRPDGNLDYVGAAGSVFEGDGDGEGPVLIFSGN